MAQVAKKMARNAKSKSSQRKGGLSQSGGGSKQPTLHEQVQATIKRLQAEDPGLKQLMKKAYGYAVFPSVGKAALVVGGAYGRGEVYEQGKMIGHATIGQLTIGVQIGGDTFDELIVFESEEPLKRFKQSRTKFAANASAVLVKAGAAASSNFEKGASVFVYSEGGMLLELAIGGQKFKFKPGKIGDEEKASGGKAKASQRGGGGAQEGADEDAADEDAGDEQRDEDGNASTLGAASKGFKLMRNHPVWAAVIGAGVAFYAVSRLMSTASGSDEDEDDSEASDDDDEAEGSYEDEGSGEEEEDEEDDDRGSDEDEDEGEADEEEEESSRSSRSRR